MSDKELKPGMEIKCDPAWEFTSLNPPANTIEGVVEEVGMISSLIKFPNGKTAYVLNEAIEPNE